MDYSQWLLEEMGGRSSAVERAVIQINRGPKEKSEEEHQMERGAAEGQDDHSAVVLHQAVRHAFEKSLIRCCASKPRSLKSKPLRHVMTSQPVDADCDRQSLPWGLGPARLVAVVLSPWR